MLSEPVVEEGVHFVEKLFEGVGYVSPLVKLTSRTRHVAETAVNGAEYLQENLAEFADTIFYNDEPESVRSRMHSTALTAISLFEVVWKTASSEEPGIFQQTERRKQAAQKDAYRIAAG